MKHESRLGVRRDHLYPACSCGRWTGQPTRWTAQATAQFNVHLAAVNAPQPAPVTDVWARRYLGQRGSVA
jgi:hypothetical protein